MLIPRSRTVTIDTANPTVPVEVVPAPAAGTTNLLYSIMLMNSDLGARDLDFYLTDGVDTVYLIQERGVAFATRYLYPPEDSEGPLHQVCRSLIALKGDHQFVTVPPGADVSDGVTHPGPPRHPVEVIASPLESFLEC